MDAEYSQGKINEFGPFAEKEEELNESESQDFISNLANNLIENVEVENIKNEAVEAEFQELEEKEEENESGKDSDGESTVIEVIDIKGVNVNVKLSQSYNLDEEDLSDDKENDMIEPLVEMEMDDGVEDEDEGFDNLEKEEFFEDEPEFLVIKSKKVSEVKVKEEKIKVKYEEQENEETYIVGRAERESDTLDQNEFDDIKENAIFLGRLLVSDPKIEMQTISTLNESFVGSFLMRNMHSFPVAFMFHSNVSEHFWFERKSGILRPNSVYETRIWVKNTYENVPLGKIYSPFLENALSLIESKVTREIESKADLDNFWIERIKKSNSVVFYNLQLVESPAPGSYEDTVSSEEFSATVCRYTEALSKVMNKAEIKINKEVGSYKNSMKILFVIQILLMFAIVLYIAHGTMWSFFTEDSLMEKLNSVFEHLSAGYFPSSI